MNEERTSAISESGSLLMIPENGSLPMIPDTVSPPLISGKSSASNVSESDFIPVTLENSEPKSHHVRRNSTGDLVIPYTRVKILSRYLAASTGSCHDYCKYGMKQPSETKTLEPISERVKKGEGAQNVEKTTTSAERKKKLTVCLMSSIGSKIQKTDSPKITKGDILPLTKREIVLSKQLSYPFRGKDFAVNHDTAPKQKTSQSKISAFPLKGASGSKENAEIKENKERGFVLNSDAASGSGGNGESIGIKEMRTSIHDEKKVSVASSIKKILKRPIVSLSSKRSVKRVSTVEKLKSLNGYPDQNGEHDVGKAESEQTNKEDALEKSLYVSELNDEKKTRRPTQNRTLATASSPCASLSPKDKNLKRSRNGKGPTRLPPPSPKLILRRTQKRIQLSQSSPFLRHTKDGAPFIQSSISSLASSKSADCCTSSEHDETQIETRVMTTKVGAKTRPRKGGETSKKDKDSPGSRPNFRAGKVVQLQTDTRTPRRLKFKRRVRGNGQIGKADAKNIILTKTEVEGDEEIEVAEPESEKVILRHQDVEGKEAVQTLLNKMIEETASKLVATRKGKVKALVGAFEVVISLQDSKRLSTVSSL